MLWILISIGVVVLDQLSKYLFSLILPNEGYSITVIPGFFEFERVHNPAAGFGILADNRWVFMVFSSVAIVLIILYFIIKRPKSKLLTVALSFILGGGIGNMIDRFGIGITGDKTVFDFIGFRFFTYDFPRFNLADSFITVGAVLLIIFVLASDSFLKKHEADS